MKRYSLTAAKIQADGSSFAPAYFTSSSCIFDVEAVDQHIGVILDHASSEWSLASCSMHVEPYKASRGYHILGACSYMMRREVNRRHSRISLTIRMNSFRILPILDYL
jgi:hypothetical protein